MPEVKVIKINQDVNASNQKSAEMIRKMFKDQGTLFLNVMSSPGSGKTTLLTVLINELKKDLKIGEMDVDIKSSVDAQRVADNTGISSIQIHNGGLCHIDADMVTRALLEYDTKGLDLLILENIGNLVCPAEFDTGAHKNIMLLSIPEGDDKPLKYPLMFSICDLILITKMDTIEYFDFDIEKAKERILKLNPKATIIPVSSKNKQGIDELCEWIKNELKNIKEN